MVTMESERRRIGKVLRSIQLVKAMLDRCWTFPVREWPAMSPDILIPEPRHFV
jgi:hypothetical protein